LLGLRGFSVQRIAAGYDWRRGEQRLGITVAVDNLTDRFYREHFQFAPARGRSFTVALHVRGSR
jgi:outer membrane receptor protein involved in Fe transport